MTKDQRRRAGLCPRTGHAHAVAWGLCAACAARHARYHRLRTAWRVFRSTEQVSGYGGSPATRHARHPNQRHRSVLRPAHAAASQP